VEIFVSEPSSIRDIISLWPTRAALFADLRDQLPEDVPLSVHQVQKWAEKQSIPARYHYPFLRAAEVRGFAVTADQLARLHAQPLRGAA
jgi:hypothetical protein